MWAYFALTIVFIEVATEADYCCNNHDSVKQHYVVLEFWHCTRQGLTKIATVQLIAMYRNVSCCYGWMQRIVMMKECRFVDLQCDRAG
jgi:hypothetical protein